MEKTDKTDKRLSDTVLLLNLKVQRILSYQRIKERVKRFQNLKQRKSII